MVGTLASLWSKMANFKGAKQVQANYQVMNCDRFLGRTHAPRTSRFGEHAHVCAPPI